MLRLSLLKSCLSALCWIALLLLLQTCKSKQTAAPQAPEASYQDLKALNHTSYLSTKVSLSVPQIKKRIEQETQGWLYEDASYSNNGQDNLKLRARRKGEVALWGRQGYIYYKVPIYIEGSYHFEKDWMGMQVEKDLPFDFSARFNFATSVNLQPNWQVRTRTTPNAFDWIKEPALHFSGISIPLSDFVEPVLQEQQTSIAQMLDREIAKVANLRSLMKEAWNDLQQPIKLYDDPLAYLYIQPKAFYHSGLQGNRREIGLSAALHAQLITQLGPKQKLAKAPLAPARKEPTLEDDFSLILMARLPFTEANQWLQEHVKGRDFEFKNGKKTVHVEGIRVYGQGPKLVLELQCSGDLEGEVYLLGKPYYDKEARIIGVEDLTWDLESEQFLITTADWLGRDFLARQLEKRLRLPLGQRIDSLQQMVEQEINGKKVNQFIRPELNIQGIQPLQIQVAERGLFLGVEAKGRLQLDLDALNME